MQRKSRSISRLGSVCSLRALSAAVMAALFGSSWVAHAQVTADPHAGAHRPGVSAAGNGVPVVNVTAPSAAGVSHNQYQNFNVDTQGLILNNAAGMSKTQLGGYVVGNPNYQAGQSARVIVNEVTSTNPTVLRGYIEVAGNAADLIIANPNGISVNGGGFINTTRATLTTGVPVFGGDGSLGAFRATRGNISIDGAGLDATPIDRLDIIARSVTANAKVWANNLNVVTGANQVNYTDLSAQTLAGEGIAPGVSLDVAALGGMYANKILLVGTEAGVGVRNAGELASQSGDFTISQSGQLQLSGTISSSGNITLSGSGLINSGTLQSGGNLSIQTVADTNNSGTLYSGGNLSINAASLNNSHSMRSAGSMTVQNAGDIANTGSIYSAGDINLSTGGALSHSGVIAAANNATLRAQQLTSMGTIGAGVASDGNLQGNSVLTLNVDSLVNGGTLQSSGDTAIQAIGNASNAGTVYSGGHLAVTAGSLSNSHAMQSANSMTLQSAGDITNTGTVYSAGDLDVNAGGTLSSNNVIAAANNTTVRAQQLASTGTLGAGVASDGSLQGHGALDIVTNGALGATGSNLAASSITLQGSALNLSGAQTRAGSDIALISNMGDIDHSNATLATNGALSVQSAGNVNNTGGALQAGQLAIHAGSFTNAYGSVMQTGSAPMNVQIGGMLDNTHGAWVGNAQNISMHAGTLNNTSGAIEHAGDGLLSLTTDGALTNTQGQILGNGQLALDSQTLANDSGTLSVAGDAAIMATDLDNTAGTVVAHNTQATLSGTLTNQDGLWQAGGSLLIAVHALNNGNGQIKALGGNLGFTAAQALNNGANGFIGSNATVNLAAGGLSNAGQIYAGNDLNLNVQGEVINAGAVQAQGSLGADIGGGLTNDNGQIEAGSGQGSAMLGIHAASVSNQSGRIANAGNGVTTINASGALNNTGGTLGGQGDVTLVAAQVTNNSGTLVASGNVALQSSYLSNNGGTLYSAGDISWNNGAATLDNTHGSIGAGGDLTFTLDTLHNDNGDIATNGNESAQLNTFDGVGRLRAGQNLLLTLSGDYTNQAGNALFANNDFTFNLGGALTNASGATLQSVGALTLNAASLDNQANADINSANTTLTTSGDQRNEGRIEGDNVTLHAGNVTNTGTVIGGAITINANSLTNGADLGTATDNNPYQSALIAAVNNLSLYITGDVLNRDAMLYSLGDMTIAADTSLNRNHSITNLSGDIEAGGDITLATEQFTNQRRVFDTSVYTLTPEEQAQNTTTQTLARYLWNDANSAHRPPYVDDSQVIDADEYTIAKAFCDNLNGSTDNQRCAGYPNGNGSPNAFQGIFTSTLTSVTQIDATSAQGRLLAGGNISINGSVLNDKSTIAAGNNFIANGADGSDADNTSVQNIAWVPTGTVLNTISEQSATQQLVEEPHREWIDGPWMSYGSQNSTSTLPLGVGQIPSWITFNIGVGASAAISAGNAVDITAQDVSNIAVGNDGKPVVGVGLGSNAGTSPITGQQGPNASGVGELLPGAQMVGTPGNPLGPIPLPSSGLYTINPGNGSPYLVVTDPRFASMSGFLGSDYLLDQLGLGGDSVLKRLGDAFYETQLVMDQITDLTGRRYLNGETDALDQYKALMDAGAQDAKQFDLTVGVALTPQQMAGLTQDMVWLVTEQVDGQSVLVPVVYLSSQTANNVASGAVIQGNTVNINASGQLTNTGTLQASSDATVKAGNLLNAGELSAGGNLSVQAAQDLLNTGTIQGGNVALVAGNNLLSSANASHVNLGTVNLSDLSLNDAQRLGVSTGGQVSTSGTLTAQAGNNLTLDHATVSAGQNLGLAAGNDFTATASTLSAGGDAQLIAGNNLSLNAQGSTQRQGTQMNGTQSTTYAVTSVTAGGNAVLAAGNDITSQASNLLAGNTLAVSAGHDVNLTAFTESTTTSAQGFQGNTLVTASHSDQTVQGNTFSGTNGVAISAGHDLNATAGTLTSTQGDVALAAGNNINLVAGQETHTQTRDTRTSTSNLISSKSTVTHDATSDTYAVGTQLSGNNVSLAAGDDLNAQAAYINANNALTLAAGHNVNLTDAHDTHSEAHDTETKSFNFFSDSSKRFGSVDPEWRDNVNTTQSQQSTSVGTVLSGDSVTIAAGHNLSVTNAQIVGTHDVTLAAGNDLTLNAGENTYASSQGASTSHTGLMNNGGLSVLIGNRSTKDSYTASETSYTGSTVGSLDGSVTLSAGNNMHITGSDVLSQTGTAIVGKNVTIDAAVGTADTSESHKISTGGINVGIGGAVADSINGAIYSVQRGSDVKDKRLSALYAAQASYQASDAVGYAQAGGLQGATKPGPDGKGGNPGGVNLQVGIGGSSASSNTTTYDETTYGSHIRSQGDVTIAATGGDLNVIGSQISGDNVALAAQNNINLLSQAENHSLQNGNKNISGGVGIQIGSDGVGFYAQASGGEGSARGNGITHTDTTVNASNTLTLISGNDTTLKGAQLTGNQVVGAIGNNLLIQSEQDTDDYASKQWQAGGKVVIGYGSGASASYSQSNVNSHYASVMDVSGINAGDGGFNIAVGNNTHLIGGVIASSADPSKNLLNTGSLTYESIHNEANYSASSVGVSGGYGGGSSMGGNALSGIGSALSLATPQKGNNSSETNSGIAQGTIIQRDGNTNLSGLDRNPTLDNQTLAPIFDAQKVQNNIELGQLAGYVGMRTAGGIANYMADRAATDADKASWSDGGANKILLHGLVGAATAALGGGDALQGAVGAAASEAASKAMQQYLDDHGITDPSQRNALMQLGSVAMGGAVGGGAGAATALQGDLYNRQLHPDEISLAKKLADESGGLYTQEQIEDAMRISGDKALNETSQTGMLVNVNDSGSIYDEGASWQLIPGPIGTQYLMQQMPSQISPDLATYVTANTGGGYSPYTWSNEQQGLRSTKEPYIPYLAIIPDYVSISGIGLGLGGSVALNLHTGQVYAGGSANDPVEPGAGFVFGWLPSNLGIARQQVSINTANFLAGAGAAGAICDVLCAGVNHSYGGDTSIELGGGLKVPAKGVSGSTGIMKPWFILPFTPGDQLSAGQRDSRK